MRVFLDACVLFPPMVRSLILGMAEAGAFQPLWSERVLDEWCIAVARQHGAEGAQGAAAARLAMAEAFPNAKVSAETDLERTLVLPDPGDVHVLAAAIAAQADVLLTFNLKDFPARTLAGHEIEGRHPDGFLWEVFSGAPDVMGTVTQDVLIRFAVAPESARAALKRARLGRFAKAYIGRF